MKGKALMRARTGSLRLFCFLLLACGGLLAQAPVLFFSDIASGPNTGGENGNGAYVTIYGNYLGASQGASTATAGGGSMGNCPVWGAAWLWYQKITCQLGPNAATGSLIVTVNGQASNPLPFTVAPGNVYFVATSGSDNNSGAFAKPWRTLLKARGAMLPGDITYAMDGVTQSTDDGTGWDAAFLLSGGGQGNWCSAAGLPRALAAYPGATVTIGNPSGGLPDYGLRTSDCQGNWVFSGIGFRGQTPALSGSGTNYRFTGSDITCPYTQGSGGGACFQTSQASYVTFYGNHVYNAGTANASALFQAVYFSTDSNDIDMGWNLVEYVHGCRGLQVHSSPLGSGGAQDPTGHDQYDISIHDNTIHDMQCDGMIVDTVDPSQGPITVYNNVIYNAGMGPGNPEGTGGWNCINIPGSTENGPAGSGTVEVFNNTLFACGTFASPPYGSDNNAVAENGGEAPGAPPIYVHIRNNLMDSVPTTLFPGGVPYVVVWDPVTGEPCANSQDCPWLFGTNNLMYGAGNPVTDLAQITGSVSADPLVVSTSLPDLHLTAGSPAIQAGAVIGAIGVFGVDNTGRDHDGLLRSAVPAIGAYELNGSSGGNPSVSINPPQATLTAGQAQQFSATVTGSGNTAVAWSMNPVFGTLSSTGLYTSPASVPSPESVAITATSLANPAASAAAIALVNPSSVSVAVNPAAATLGASQSMQLAAQVTGAANTAVTWSMTPAMGKLSASGLYTAPASSTATRAVTVTATSVADSTKSAAASITLLPAGQFSISYTLVGSTAVQVSWTAPSGRPANDWIGLSSVGAPGYWYTWSQNTGGAAAGSVVVNLPASPGIWVFRYCIGSGCTIAAASAPLAVGVSGFTVNASPGTVAAGASLTVAWMAPAGRPAGDSVALFRAGVSNTNPAAVYDVSGSGGTFTMPAPHTAGQYRFRYLLGGSGWITAALGPVITVQ
jgi:hypothetical protein